MQARSFPLLPAGDCTCWLLCSQAGEVEPKGVSVPEVCSARLFSDPATTAGPAEPCWCTQRCGKQQGPALQITGKLGACSCQGCRWAAQLEVSGARVPPTWLPNHPLLFLGSESISASPVFPSCRSSFGLLSPSLTYTCSHQHPQFHLSRYISSVSVASSGIR